MDEVIANTVNITSNCNDWSCDNISTLSLASLSRLVFTKLELSVVFDKDERSQLSHSKLLIGHLVTVQASDWLILSIKNYLTLTQTALMCPD